MHLTHTNRVVRNAAHRILDLVAGPLSIVYTGLRAIRNVVDTHPSVLNTRLRKPFLTLSHGNTRSPRYLGSPIPRCISQLLRTTSNYLHRVAVTPRLPRNVSTVHHFTTTKIIPTMKRYSTSCTATHGNFSTNTNVVARVFGTVGNLRRHRPNPVPTTIRSPHIAVRLVGSNFRIRGPVIHLKFNFTPRHATFIASTVTTASYPSNRCLLNTLSISIVSNRTQLISGNTVTNSALALRGTIRHTILRLKFAPTSTIRTTALAPTGTFNFSHTGPIAGRPLNLLTPNCTTSILLLSPTA